ncbi:hypothetical protein PR202_ga21998 [Eleusine coracana subsp. coracana]|uniref:KIB1-4 beta-propeller domain-containing protein n=1 Tax=Eleusine coracana subsp. coracana TaxID=191504 RepID=A0AAV5D2W3_ELECO|nr:hypothetical protein PR202_ga21998 [Eleusine coracana subsp. coracana]
MDSGAGTASEPLLPFAAFISSGFECRLPGVGCHCLRWLVLAGKVFDERLQEERPKFDSEPSWAGLQADALGVVLRFLPLKADRSRLRSVCRNWRAAASGHAVPPPLPMLVLPRFRFSSLSPRGALTAARQAWMPPEVAPDHVHCVGSSGEWLVGARQAFGECFLVNAFSQKLVNLPCLSDSGYRCSLYSLHKVALSALPDSGSECIVAAFGFRGSNPELSLWKPGMMSWHVCRDALIAGHVDIVFYQGKLYMLWRFTPCLFSFEPGSISMGYYGGAYHQAWRNVLKVEVLTLDFSTKPYGVTEIHGFGTDCVFVGPGGNSFPAALHDGLEDELIYFVPDHYNPHDAYVYNMKDGAVRPFGFESQPASFATPEDNLGFPVWLFPSE